MSSEVCELRVRQGATVRDLVWPVSWRIPAKWECIMLDGRYWDVSAVLWDTASGRVEIRVQALS